MNRVNVKKVKYCLWILFLKEDLSIISHFYNTWMLWLKSLQPNIQNVSRFFKRKLYGLQILIRSFENSLLNFYNVSTITFEFRWKERVEGEAVAMSFQETAKKEGALDASAKRVGVLIWLRWFSLPSTNEWFSLESLISRGSQWGADP